MSTSITLNGVGYTIPAVGEDSWGTQVSNYLVALSTGVLSKAGGAFTLTADADFGANFGLKSIYYKSRGTTATTGVVRLANAEVVSWRNAANSANLSLTVSSSNVLTFDGNPIVTLALGTADYVLKMNSGGTAYEWGLLANANIDASAAIAYSKLNLATSIVNADVNGSAAIAYSKLNLSGSIVNADVGASAAIAYSKLNLSGSIVNADVGASAAIAYSKLNLATSIVNADVNASAAIALTKLAATTASRALVSDGSGFVTPATTTATEIGYVNGVTSAIQTQFTGKASTALSNLASVAINTTLVSDTDNTDDLGSSAITWRNAYLKTGLVLQETGVGTDAITISAPAALSASYALVLPGDDGNSGQVLSTNGTGTLSWASPFTNPMTTTGDIVYSSDGSGTPARLGIGASTTVLVGGTTPSWAQIANAQISSSAAIAYSKLASLTSAHILVGSAGNVATDTAVTGDVTISNTGVTAIGSGVIVDADVNASAAIAGTKISPVFGTQNMTITGSVNVSAGGVFLDGANQRVGIGVASPTMSLSVHNQSASENIARIIATETGNAYTGKVLQLSAHRTGNSAYYFLICESDTDGTPDAEFLVQGNGVVASDGGTAMSTPADYAEMFEWLDGNPLNEDRVGLSVVLEDGMIREALTGETPIGVISGNPAVLGDAAWNKWSKKYLKDEFNRYILSETGDRILSPEFDPSTPYIPRSERQEWSPVGLVGKLNIRLGQQVAPNWIKLDNISPTVERWLVR